MAAASSRPSPSRKGGTRQLNSLHVWSAGVREALHEKPRCFAVMLVVRKKISQKSWVSIGHARTIFPDADSAEGKTQRVSTVVDSVYTTCFATRSRVTRSHVGSTSVLLRTQACNDALPERFCCHVAHSRKHLELVIQTTRMLQKKAHPNENAIKSRRKHALHISDGRLLSPQFQHFVSATARHTAPIWAPIHGEDFVRMSRQIHEQFL
jgi:hypothetical protein